MSKEIQSLFKKLSSMESNLVDYCDLECPNRRNCEGCPIATAKKIACSISKNPQKAYFEDLTEEQEVALNSYGRHFTVVKGGKN